MHTDSGVDAGYPEAAKLPLAVPAMLIGVVQAVNEGLASSFQKAMAHTSVTPRLGDHPLVSSFPRYPSLDPAQVLSPSGNNFPLGPGIGKKATYTLSKAPVYSAHRVEFALHRSSLLTPRVIDVRLAPPDLAPASNAKAPLDAGVSFQLKFGQRAPPPPL